MIDLYFPFFFADADSATFPAPQLATSSCEGATMSMQVKSQTTQFLFEQNN